MLLRPSKCKGVLLLNCLHFRWKLKYKHLPSTLQIILDLCIPEKELAKLVPKFYLYISEVIHDILSETT